MGIRRWSQAQGRAPVYSCFKCIVRVKKDCSPVKAQFVRRRIAKRGIPRNKGLAGNSTS